MESSFMQRHPFIKDTVGLVIFVSCVLLGTILINAFIFRSFNVVGPSMQTTMYTGDRLIVNRLAVTWDKLQSKPYVPQRGQIIVFKNPHYGIVTSDEYIVKRVIAFPGERVTVADGVLTVYNSEHPAGFHPDDTNHGEPGSPTSGNVDMTVTEGTLFVAGDHRQGDFSRDSRSGLGLIPYYDIVGPVALRIYPFTAIRTF